MASMIIRFSDLCEMKPAREAVIRAAARISESSVKLFAGRQHLAMVAQCRPRQLRSATKTFHVAAKFSEKLGGVAHAVRLQRAVNHGLRDSGIEVSG